MRMLFVSSMGGAPWGGSEELWAAAARRAIQAGHEVAVSVFDFGVPVVQIDALAAAGAKVIRRPRKPSRLLDILRTPEWLHELRGWKADVVCLSQGSAYECVGRRSTRRLLEWFESDAVPLVNIVQFNEPRNDLRSSTLKRSRRLYALASCNAFVAARNIAEASATLGETVPRSCVVRNPVNLADTTPLPWRASGGGPRLACVARLHVDAKGQDMLLLALAQRPWRNEAWSLSLFGTGKDEDALRAQASRLGLSAKVTFAGQASDIRSVFANHDMLVLPSRAEGTPLAMVEAMLLGRPCLTTDVGGCSDWIVEGENGWLASKHPQPPTPETIGKALDRAWACRERWSEMGKAACATAEQLHDPDPGRTVLGLMEAARAIV